MKKHLISILVLFLMVSTPLVGVSTLMINDTDSLQMLNDEDISNEQFLQYATDWSVHLTNQTTSEVISGSSYNYMESRSREPNSVSGPMNSPWPMYQHDVSHTGRSLYSTENNSGINIWRFREYGSDWIWGSSAIDSDGVIYFGSSGNFNLYALNANGSKKWVYQGDGTIWGTPAIAEDGTIIFTTLIGMGNVHAVYPNGTVKWTYRNSYWSSAISSPAIGSDGTIYFGSDHNDIYALKSDGTLKWRYPTGDIIMGSPAFAQDGSILIGSGDHYLYALFPDGQLHWRYPTGDEIKGSASVAPDGTIYIPSFNGYFYALYGTNGSTKWQASTGNSIAAAGVALAQDGTIYVGTEKLRAYNPDGTLKWITDVQGSVYGSVPAVSADGTIYVSAGGSLVAVNPDGTIKWRKQLSPAQIRSSPSIGPNDRVYVGSGDNGDDYGYFYAFGNGPLLAEASGPYNGAITEPVQFIGEAFGGTPPYSSYHWNFGDGNTSQDQNPTHIYMRRDNYTAILTVTDSTGNQSSDTAQVKIGYALPKITIIKPINAIYFFNIKICRFIDPTVIGPITIKVDVTQVDAEIDRVEFYHDGDVQFIDRSPPYQMLWKHNQQGNGEDFWIYAYDTVGQRSSKLIYIIKYL